MPLIILPFQDWFAILFAKLCLNSYGTRVNQYCESNVTRGQGKQKMVREKSGKKFYEGQLLDTLNGQNS